MTIENKRILIVEDNYLVGEYIAQCIDNVGGHSLGPVLTRAEALDLINFDPVRLDAVVLDVVILDGSEEIADRLASLDVPFVYSTGSPDRVPVQHRHRPICAKPYSPRQLLELLEKALEPSGTLQAAVIAETMTARSAPGLRLVPPAHC
jgi:CheY-like chemotaxis protein